MNMDDAFEKRKLELVRLVNELYKEKPATWLQEKGNVYKSTWNVGNEVDDIPPEKEEIVVLKSIKAYILISSALSLLDLILIDEYFKSGELFLLLVIIAVTGFFVYSFVLSYDRRPRIIINKKGIWLRKMDCIYEWHLIGATFIKEDDRDESTVLSLVIYYYELAEHNFIRTEYEFPSFINLSVPEIAYYIEYWKIKTGNKTPAL